MVKDFGIVKQKHKEDMTKLLKQAIVEFGPIAKDMNSLAGLLSDVKQTIDKRKAWGAEKYLVRVPPPTPTLPHPPLLSPPTPPLGPLGQGGNRVGVGGVG